MRGCAAINGVALPCGFGGFDVDTAHLAKLAPHARGNELIVVSLQSSSKFGDLAQRRWCAAVRPYLTTLGILCMASAAWGGVGTKEMPPFLKAEMLFLGHPSRVIVEPLVRRAFNKSIPPVSGPGRFRDYVDHLISLREQSSVPELEILRCVVAKLEAAHSALGLAETTALCVTELD